MINYDINRKKYMVLSYKSYQQYKLTIRTNMLTMLEGLEYSLFFFEQHCTRLFYHHQGMDRRHFAQNENQFSIQE